MLGKLLIRYLKPYRWLLLGVLVFQFLSALASLYLPSLNADIIDDGVAKGDTDYIWSTGAFMLAISLAQIVAAIIATYFAAKAAMKLGRDIRNDVFDKVSAFSEREVSKFGPGSLITRNTNDVQQVQMLAMTGATMLVSAPLLAIGGIVMALQQDMGLSWLIGASVLVILVVAIIVIARMVPMFRSFQVKLDAVNRILREQLTGIRVVRAFVRERIEEHRFRVANTDIMDVGRRVGTLFVTLFPLFMLVLNVTVIGVIWFGAIEVNDGNVEIGTLFAFMQYVGIILGGVLMAAFTTIMIPRAAVSGERISEVLASESTLTRPANAVDRVPRGRHGGVRRRRLRLPRSRAPGARRHLVPGRRAARPSRSSARPVRARRRSSRCPAPVRRHGRLGARQRRRRARGRPRRACGRPSASCRSVPSSSPAPWHPTSGSVARRPPTPSSGTHSRSPRAATSSPTWRADSTHASHRAAPTCRAGSGSASRSPGRSCTGPTSSSSTTRSRRSTSPPTRGSDRRCGGSCHEVTKIVVAQRVSTITDADRIIVLDDGGMVGIGTHDELLETCETYRQIVESQLGVEAHGMSTDTKKSAERPRSSPGRTPAD